MVTRVLIITGRSEHPRRGLGDAVIADSSKPLESHTILGGVARLPLRSVVWYLTPFKGEVSRMRVYVLYCAVLNLLGNHGLVYTK